MRIYHPPLYVHLHDTMMRREKSLGLAMKLKALEGPPEAFCRRKSTATLLPVIDPVDVSVKGEDDV